jgi:thiol-disulfide isomerase/thioredoxin
MKKIITALCILLQFSVNAQDKNTQEAGSNDISELKQSIETYPDSITLQQKYIKAVGLTDPALLAQYKEWMKKFPDNANFPFALGEAYWNKELPEATPWLLKAVQIDPKFAKGYFYLWIDGDRWGDFAKSRGYIKRAAELEPNNPDYAFYYANTFENDPVAYRERSLDVASRFPESERGAQALYWLAARNTDPSQRMEYYELLKTKFPPDKFSWSSSGMSGYFDLLLEQSPAKAVALAQSMVNIMTKKNEKEEWDRQLTVANNIVQAQSLLSQNKPGDAAAVLEKTKVSRWSQAKNTLLILKAKALDADGKTAEAYDELRIAYAGSPEEKIGDEVSRYGTKLGKSGNEIEKDIWYVRDTSSRQATPFSLKQYMASGKLSLADLKGKVVLLTYWFPGCGPCRGEFPHFQNVVNKFKGQDLVYVGINIEPDQNEYVIPFMKSSGYTFIPLEDVPDRKKGNLDNHNAAPMNFLIDKTGKIVYKNFRIDEGNEDLLQSMIGSLLTIK